MASRLQPQEKCFTVRLMEQKNKKRRRFLGMEARSYKLRFWPAPKIKWTGSRN